MYFFYVSLSRLFRNFRTFFTKIREPVGNALFAKKIGNKQICSELQNFEIDRKIIFENFWLIWEKYFGAFRWKGIFDVLLLSMKKIILGLNEIG